MLLEPCTLRFTQTRDLCMHACLQLTHVKHVVTSVIWYSSSKKVAQLCPLFILKCNGKWIHLKKKKQYCSQQGILPCHSKITMFEQNATKLSFALQLPEKHLASLSNLFSPLSFKSDSYFERACFKLFGLNKLVNRILYIVSAHQ